MIFKARNFSLLVCCFFFLGCASNLYFQPIDNHQQTMFYNQGMPVLLTEKDVRVFLQPLGNDGGRPRFVIMVFNDSDRMFDFSVENIKAKLNDQDIKIFTYDELKDQIEGRAKMARVLTALSGGLNSASAGMTAGYTQNSGTFEYYDNNSYGYGTYRGHSYNSNQAFQAQQAINQQTEAQISQIQNQESFAINNIQNILKKTTVTSGNKVAGIIVLDNLKCGATYQDKLNVLVNILEKDYVFDMLCGNVRLKSNSK